MTDGPSSRPLVDIRFEELRTAVGPPPLLQDISLHVRYGEFFTLVGAPHSGKSALLRAVSALFPLWVALGLLLPAALGGLISGNWAGVWTGFLWGGLARVFLVHHVTWSVNSACHLWGLRPYKSEDESRNNVVFGILAMGEGGTTPTTRSRPRRDTD